jgi:acyl-CoA thioester hydrolase
MTSDCNQTSFRVRYSETDRMGFVYYGVYATWLEVGRVEYLRQRGLAYKDIEDSGLLLAVRKLEIDYLAPARYDDLICVQTLVTAIGKSRIDFESRIMRGDELLATGRVGLACLTHQGRPQRISQEIKKACLPAK